MSSATETATAHVGALIGRGRELLELYETGGSPAAAAAQRIWQHDAAAAVNQLSGGSKSHWLARAYGEAFLVRGDRDEFVGEAMPGVIISRILTVLERAARALTAAEQVTAPGETSPASDRAAPAARFDFVHDPDLRPVLDAAYRDARAALDSRDFCRALALSAGVLEAIITDALLHRAPPDRAGRVAAWSFDARIAAAEDAALVRGCRRLPAAARRYRDPAGSEGELTSSIAISERDARVTAQVLHVVMHDLNPGR